MYKTPSGISTKAYSIPEYGYEDRPDLTEMSGNQGIKVFQKSQNLSVRVTMLYRTPPGTGNKYSGK